jgi:hypothetical protein
MIELSENIYTVTFTDGDRALAMHALRVPADAFKAMDFRTLRLGFALGFTFVRCAWLTVDVLKLNAYD